MSTEKFAGLIPEIQPICEVINNNQAGWQNIVETLPGVTLEVGAKLYMQKDVFKIFFALGQALQRIEQLEKREAIINSTPRPTPGSPPLWREKSGTHSGGPVRLQDGKYVFYLKKGVLCCDRYNEPWREFVGDHAVHALFDALCEARDELEKQKVGGPPPVVTPMPSKSKLLKSEPPKGVMAALLAGWSGHNPTIYWVGALPDHKPWVSLWGPREGPNADWRGISCNFDLEPELISWLQWAAADKQREICRSIQKALGLC